MVCIHKEYYSAIKNNEIMSFVATWMKLEILIPREVSQKEKDKHIWYHLYIQSKILDKWTYLQNRNRLTDMENRLVFANGEEGENGITGKLGLVEVMPLEWRSYCTAQGTVSNLLGQEMMGNDMRKIMYIYIYDRKLTQHCKSAIL